MAKNKKTKSRERRKHRRVPLNLLVQHRYESFGDFMQEAAEDISVGGMFLRSDKLQKVGDTIYLRFALSDGLPLIEGIGRVVRVNDGDDPQVVRGMGIEFVSMDRESRKLIESIVAERFVES